MMRHCARCVLMMAAVSWAAAGQSLYERPVADGPAREGVPVAGAAPSAPLNEVSLMAVEPPKPREFQAEDLVTIVISERQKLDRKQKGESKKNYDNDFAIEAFIDLINLLETRIEPTSSEHLPVLSLKADNNFKGDAKYLREDKLTDRLTAKVLEVKPNGTLVLEARRQWTTDEEDQVAVLSGICRAEDITDQNTVQSNQLYDLRLVVENNGDLDRTTKKGLIPRIWETLVNF